jgi:hypothetical protein
MARYKREFEDSTTFMRAADIIREANAILDVYNEVVTRVVMNPVDARNFRNVIKGAGLTRLHAGIKPIAVQSSMVMRVGEYALYSDQDCKEKQDE